MKKLILGIAMFITGIIGTGFMMIIAEKAAENFGSVNGENNFLIYWNLHGITPFTILFVLMIVVGLFIAIKDAYSK